MSLVSILAALGGTANSRNYRWVTVSKNADAQITHGPLYMYLEDALRSFPEPAGLTWSAPKKKKNDPYSATRNGETFLVYRRVVKG